MKFQFVKYQGTGNDFVMVDNRSGKWNSLSLEQIRTICDRRFGVGADGLILINTHPTHAFEVDYYNADGSKSFCGNGARCSVAFAKTLGIPVDHVRFMAIDGEHEATEKDGIVSLRMNPVNAVSKENKDFVLYTGSPHYIRFVENTSDVDVFNEGRAIRYSDTYKEEGINVNFVASHSPVTIDVVTYERGVEDETLSCGTGVTAAALVQAVMQSLYGLQTIAIQTKGGQLQVRFNRTGETTFDSIDLIGPAERVFEGIWNDGV